MVPEAKSVVERFFNARTVEEKARFVRGGEAMLPAMREFYPVHPDQPETISLASSAEFDSVGDRDFIVVTGSRSDGTSFGTYVERTPSGPRLDWRFLTGAGEMEWSRWIKERPARPVTLRALVCMDDYYGGAFSDRNEWLAMKITDISLDKTVWAYAERLSDTGLYLAERMAGVSRVIRIVGSFEFPAVPLGSSTKPSETPQVIVRSVQTKGSWLDCSPEATGGLPPAAPVTSGP
jgi:hypothetical protein